MSELGELVLIIGDFHTPARAFDLPTCFSELLNTDKIRTVLCTGSLGNAAMLERIKGLGQTVHIVRGVGDTDDIFESLPEKVVTTVGKFIINPGSATGTFTGIDVLQPSAPSFMLMAVQGDKAVVYVYEEHDGKTNVVMSEISK